jgi:hypothetical protein
MTVLQILGKPLAEALGEDIDEAFLIDAKNVATSRPARWVELALSMRRRPATWARPRPTGSACRRWPSARRSSTTCSRTTRKSKAC